MDHLTINHIRDVQNQLSKHIIHTPVLSLSSDKLKEFLPLNSDVKIKLELFQQTGSFKARGVLLAMDRLDEASRKAGVVAVSGGNHALAVSWAAQKNGIHAIIVMPKTVNSARIKLCQDMGAEVIVKEDIAEAFAEMERISETKGYTALHPFNTENMMQGAATCGAEFADECPDLDIVVIPVGGGGLLSGMSAAIKQICPNTTIYGVEPFGASSMHQSFKAGKPLAIDKIDTIASSLASPMALARTFDVSYKNTKEIVLVSDDELRAAMRLLFDVLKIAVEPACAASLAAIMGPLKEKCEGKSVGIIACGSNARLDEFMTYVGKG